MKADDEIIYETISQASEYLSSECDNSKEIALGKRIDQLSFRINLVKGIFVKFANVMEHKMLG